MKNNIRLGLMGNDDFRSRRFVEEEIENTLNSDNSNTAGITATAIHAGIAGVLGVSNFSEKFLSTKLSTNIFPVGNGIWVPEEDWEVIEKMINNLTSKLYYIDEQGFVREVPGDKEEPEKSDTYSRILDALIEGDRKVVVGLDSGWTVYNANSDTLEKSYFNENGGAVSIGDNRTDQVVILSDRYFDVESTENNSAGIRLAHELIHAVRGVYGLKNADSDGRVNKNEEVCTIQTENQIRYELGMELRSFGSKEEDINEDGQTHDSRNHDKSPSSEGYWEWLYKIAVNRQAQASGIVYSYYVSPLGTLYLSASRSMVMEGSSVTITSSCGNADHMALHIAGNGVDEWHQFSGSYYQYPFTPYAAGIYYFTSCARNTPNEWDDYTDYEERTIQVEVSGTICGTEYSEDIWGYSGNDTMYGYGGNDMLAGQGGKDNIFGGDDNDTLWGGSGNDQLYGGEGDDTLIGESGVNVLDGGGGNDRLYGEGGTNTFVFANEFDHDRVIDYIVRMM